MSTLWCGKAWIVAPNLNSIVASLSQCMSPQFWRFNRSPKQQQKKSRSFSLVCFQGWPLDASSSCVMGLQFVISDPGSFCKSFCRQISQHQPTMTPYFFLLKSTCSMAVRRGRDRPELKDSLNWPAAALLIRENFALWHHQWSDTVIYIQVTSNNKKLCKVSQSVWSWVLLVPTVLWRWRSDEISLIRQASLYPSHFISRLHRSHKSQWAKGQGAPPRPETWRKLWTHASHAASKQARDQRLDPYHLCIHDLDDPSFCFGWICGCMTGGDIMSYSFLNILS